MESVDIEALQAWVGRAQTVDDLAATGPLAGLASLLDHETPPWMPGEVPPLAHWLYFLPRARQSLLDEDGHAKRGDFLPPVPLPRRMWAGSRVQFLAPIPFGATMSRHSTIASVTAKSGRTGPMVFVTVKHEVTVGATTAVVEEQDIVYRAPPPPDSGPAAVARAIPNAPGAGAAASGGTTGATTPAATPAPPRDAAPRPRSQTTRSFVPDPIKLFRFSALTFNAHRIHYDRDYARDVEGYPGLVVHGPLVAILLMDHYLRQGAGLKVNTFTFRAERPLFDTAAFDVCLAESDVGADLWASAANGTVAFTASVETGERAR